MNRNKIYTSSPVNVVFIDDVCRFALHLSRYLGFELGFGIGEIPWHGKYERKETTASNKNNNNKNETLKNSIFWENGAHKDIVSSNGLVYLWWVPAIDQNNNQALLNAGYLENAGWQSGLDLVLKNINARSNQNINAMSTQNINKKSNNKLKRTILIIDVRGKTNRDNQNSNNDHKECDATYSPLNVLKYIFSKYKNHGFANKVKNSLCSIYIVSSYEVGEVLIKSDKPDNRASLPIHSKSPETFRIIQSKVNALLMRGRKEEPLQKGDPNTRHFLVTGAGFELKGKQKLSEEAFGLDGTWEVLKNMGPPFRTVDKSKPDKEGDKKYRDSFEKEYQLDLCLLYDEKRTLRLDRDSDDDLHLYYDLIGNDLDTWWDLTTWQTIRSKVAPYLDKNNRDTTQTNEPKGMANLIKRRERLSSEVISIETEYRMRDAFRKTLLDYDWGHLRQCLIAAKLDWDCWFSTNYTRFADRAIQLVERINDHQNPKNGQSQDTDEAWRFGHGFTQPGQSGPHNANNVRCGLLWRIISTANAAERLITGHLHDSEHDNTVKRRYLFKLHGDIGHLHTMAITGYDKEPYTPLSMSVDSMDKIYTAAQLYLNQKCNGSKKKEGKTHAVWHVVGHGLGDKLLTRLMATQANKNEFILVSPSGGMEMFRNLCDDLQLFPDTEITKENPHLNVTIIGVKFTAAEYLSRLLLNSGKDALKTPTDSGSRSASLPTSLTMSYFVGKDVSFTIFYPPEVINQNSKPSNSETHYHRSWQKIDAYTKIFKSSLEKIKNHYNNNPIKLWPVIYGESQFIFEKTKDNKITLMTPRFSYLKKLTQQPQTSKPLIHFYKYDKSKEFSTNMLIFIIIADWVIPVPNQDALYKLEKIIKKQKFNILTLKKPNKDYKIIQHFILNYQIQTTAIKLEQQENNTHSSQDDSTQPKEDNDFRESVQTFISQQKPNLPPNFVIEIYVVTGEQEWHLVSITPTWCTPPLNCGLDCEPSKVFQTIWHSCNPSSIHSREEVKAFSKNTKNAPSTTNWWMSPSSLFNNR